MIHIVLLSGGSGTRLWPLSNSSRSKQFLKVLRDEDGKHVSMVQRVLSQVSRIPAEFDLTIATNESQRDSIRRQVDGDYSMVFEPERRDTAPAIMLSCEHLRLVQGAAPDDTVIVCPVDAYTEQGFYDSFALMDRVVQSKAAELTLLGAEPTFPSAKYGYIMPAVTEGESWPVCEFREKPDEETAAKYIDEGGLWNCGVFGFRLSTVAEIAKSYLDASDFQQCLDGYAAYPKTSFDYAVVERCGSIRVIPFRGMWKDLGTWNTLSEEMAEPYSGNVVVDEKSVDNVNAINESDLPLVVAGISDAVVVATPDGILVTGKDASSHIKDEVARAAESRPMYERKRWGEYKVINHETGPDGEESLTKELLLDPGAQLSYQQHMHRREIWTVISGRGIAVLDGLRHDVAPGSVIDVGIGVRHSIRATTSLRFIEVQIGSPLVEEDIERFGNYWDD